MENRLVIYLIYDKENIIDRYVGYMLKELREISSYIVVIINGNYIERGIENLNFADKIYFRDNIGFDVGGFQNALCQLIGWENVYKFDELVLANDSFFGPFQPMKIIFDSMSKYDYDFWSITKHALLQDEDRVIPEHVQSYFCTFRYNILHSSEFREYWYKLPIYRNFNDVVVNHEIRFTKYFYDLGYKYGCVTDMDPNNSKENCKNNYMQYGFIQYELISKRNCPILKKKPLTFDTLDLQTQENWKLALDYIKNETDYDTDLIWENLIRIMDISDIQRKFHLEYIVGRNEKSTSIYNTKIIVIASHMYTAEYVLERLRLIRDKVNIIVIASNDKLKSIYEKEGYNTYSQESVDKYQLLHSLKLEQYIVCMLYDCDVTSNEEPSCTGKSFFYNTWNNILDSDNYAGDVLRLFDEDKRLGALTPPVPNFSKYFGKAEREWDCYYHKIENILGNYGIHCQISKDKMPLTISSNVWVRGNILNKVIELKLLDSEVLPYIWSYIAQSLGYYVGIVESEDYATINEINQQFYLTQIINQVRKQYGEIENFQDLQELLFRSKMVEFCDLHQKIYVYGTGVKARQYMNMIPKMEGFIVSDGQTKEDRVNDYKVYYLSEITADDSIGVILCLNEKNQNQVIPLLEHKELEYLCI